MANKDLAAMGKKMLAMRDQGMKKKPLASKKALKTAEPAKKTAKVPKKTAPAKKALPKKAPKSLKKPMKESSAAALAAGSSPDKALMAEVQKISPKKKAPSKLDARHKELTAEMKLREPFMDLEHQLPKGGTGAMRVAADEAADSAEYAAGRALKRKSNFRTLGKAAAGLGMLAGIATGLMSDDPASALDPFNSESAGDKDQEDMDVAEDQARQKTTAKLRGEKAAAKAKSAPAAAKPKVSSLQASTKKVSPKKKSTPRAAGPKAAPSTAPKARMNPGLRKERAREEGPMEGMFDGPVISEDISVRSAAPARGVPVIQGKSPERKAQEFVGHLKSNFGDANDGDDGDLDKFMMEQLLRGSDSAGEPFRPRPGGPKKVKQPVEIKTKSFRELMDEDDDTGY